MKKFGMHQNTVSRYFRNENPMPGDFIIKVAAYAKLTLNDLMEGEMEEAQVMDITPALPPTEMIAAEPEPIYERKKSSSDPVLEINPAPLVSIDSTALTEIINKLRMQLENVEQTVIDLKEGKFTVNQ